MSSESDLSNPSISSPKQRAASKSQMASLLRIVKAQVTLLISSLNNDNYTQKETEIHTLIDTNGEDIREHLFRHLLSNIYKQDSSQQLDSPQFRLLKENAVFTTPTKDKLEATVSFSVALEQFCKSEHTSRLDLDDLFNRLEADAIDKIIFTLPLFSGVKPDIAENAKIIFTSNIQNAVTVMSTINSIPDSVLQYVFNLIVRNTQENTFSFQKDTLQKFIISATRFCTDKSMIDQFQQLIVPKAQITNQDPQFRQSIIKMYMNSPSSVTRILDLIKELNVFPDILDTLPPPLALDLVFLADHLKLLNLETWLKERLNDPQLKEAFTSQCLDYVNQKLSIESQRSMAANVDLPISLPPDVLNTFFKVLSESASSLSPQAAEALKTIENRCMQMKTQPTSSGNTVTFKPEIEEEANQYYERVYKGELSLDTMIQLLKTLSVSNDPHKQDVFACMIHNLFDEYSFFPKYPEKELSITSILFGSLIQHRLVSNASLSITLRYVLEALRNPLGSKMFNFGVQALRQFQSRLGEWPQYCSHLMQIPDLVQSQPDIAAYIQSVLSAQDSQLEEPASTTEVYRFKSVNVPKTPSPEGVVFSEPSSVIQDKILFIINNVAQNNIQSKVTDLKEVLKPSSYKWFSNYLVVKRISTEPNNHELYVLVLDSMDSQLLNALILSETCANIIILLSSEKTVSSSSERTLLKNLGSWLGRLTLAKNKPILHKHIAFKELLLEGYDRQRLIVTIPFVCKVLEQGAQSKVFRPPNPWLMAILKFLVELYDSADLKLTLKFEIEVLCKCLSLELKDIPPTTILKNRQPQVDPAKNAFAAAPYPERGSDTLSKKSLEHGFMSDTAIVIPNIAPYIVFNPQVSLYTTRPAAKRLVLQAFTESIREIIGPVVERAVAIAVVSTRDLITKDFMMEPDENKMRKAAHLMAQNLAASLAMVTSKEPLRLSIVANLKTIFLAHGLNDNVAEQAIILTVADNLDLMCAVIEKAAMEKATVEVDEVLASAYMSRQKHHEQRLNQPYVDVGTYQMSGFVNALPLPLRPRPNGLQPSQLSIYENFMRIPRVAPVAASNPSADPNYGVYNNGSPVASFESIPANQALPQVSAHLILERFAQFITELENLLSQTNVSSINNLPQQSDIRTIIRQIPLLAMSSFDKAEAARTFAQKVVQLLYKSEKALAIEVYVVLLEHLCEVSPNVGALVTSWLTHADDERKYNVPVTVALIKAGLIHLPEQDQELSILIDSGRPSAIEFSARLIRACLFGEYPLATRQEFMASLEALSRLKSNQLPESVISLVEDMRKVPSQPAQLSDMKDAGVRGQLQLYFAEWVRLCQHPSTNEKTLFTFATQLQQQNFFKMDDLSSLFYRISVEASVDHALKFKMVSTQSPSVGYQPVDALSKLIVTLVQVSLMDGKIDPLVHFTRALSVIVLCISQHHETRGDQFDQRPFLRLMTCILADLHAVEESIQPVYLTLLTAFSNTLYTLQPTHFPGFIFAWLQLISNRFFMPGLLLAENQKGWPTFHRLLISLFQFLAPNLQHVELQDTTRMLYRGSLRVLLVLLHDFPEFLCDYHYSFCDVIPSTCIQMRNLVLSAFPRHMRLPDPFTPNLKIDLLTEIHQSPRILTDFTGVLEKRGVKKGIDEYLETGKAPNYQFLKELVVQLKDHDTAFMNAVVFYVGSVTISNKIPVNKGPALEIYQYLLTELDSKGRYIFLSAIANQLRYPNSHTHYFSCLLLYLFVENKKEIAKEQITRVLLERLIVNRPHPWGLLITFIELIRNPTYSFWSHSFTRCAGDIEKLFESVSRSINQS